MIHKFDLLRYIGAAYIYSGLWYIASTEHDVNIRLGKAWSALNQMDKIWKSNLSDNLEKKLLPSSC